MNKCELCRRRWRPYRTRIPRTLGSGILIIFLGLVPLTAEASLLATNSWTVAFAVAAGVNNVDQLAPSEMTHPPEYELRPSDVGRLMNADYLLFAGYEVLMQTVFESFDLPGEKQIKIATTYHPAGLRTALMIIAERAGDPLKAREFAEKYDRLIKEGRISLQVKGLFGAPVLVHFHQKPFAEALGFEILGVYGPAPLKAGDIQTLCKTEPLLIIDNGHGSMSAPLAEITGVPVAMLRNFPGGIDEEGRVVPDTLDGVASYNLSRLLDVSRR